MVSYVGMPAGKIIFTIEEKQEIVKEAYIVQKNVNATARNYKIQTSQIRDWKKQLIGLNTRLDGFRQSVQVPIDDPELYSHLYHYLNELREKNLAVSVKMLCIEARRYVSNKDKAKAMHAIAKNIAEDQLPVIIGCGNDPKAAWDALKEEHAGSTSQDIATILMELNTRKLVDEPAIEDAREHFTYMATLVNRLKSADSKRSMSQADYATKLLLSLPNDFEQVKYARLSGPVDDLTAKNVRNDVLALLKRRDVTQSTGHGDAVLVSHQNQSKPYKFKGKCFKCGKKGHRKRECRSNGYDGSHAVVALVSSLAADKTQIKKGLRDFVIDDAANCGHTSTNKDDFESLNIIEKSERKSIGGYGKDRVEIVGKGTIVKKLANGSTLKMHDVSYTPDGSANIFAVKHALAHIGEGSEYRSTTRSCKIIDKSGKAVVTGTRRGGFQYLNLAKDQ